MIHKHVSVFAAIVCIIALSCGLLAGCANNASKGLADEQSANRAYMSQVNGLMDELNKDLDSFVEAVSHADVVTMRTQAANAHALLGKINDLDVPDSLTDIHKKYVDGIEKLCTALDDYVTLYTDMSSDSFDQSTYDNRVADIQKIYDEGVELLKEGDEAAVGKE